MHENMLKSFVKIKFEICSIHKAQCDEENSPSKFTELFQETRDTSATQGLEVALQNSSVKCLLRSYRIATQLIGNTLKTQNTQTTQTARFQHPRILVRSIRVVSFPVKILQNSVTHLS